MRYMSAKKEFVRPSSGEGPDIIVFDGRTGSGKSKAMKENVLTVKGRHLFVVPRKQSIDECEGDLKAARDMARLIYRIVPFSRDEHKRYTAKITKEITDCAAKYRRETDHCCLIITQAAFQLLHPNDFAGWHLKLDEMLTNGNPSGSLFSPIMWPGLAKLFSISPLTEHDRLLGLSDQLHRLRPERGPLLLFYHSSGGSLQAVSKPIVRFPCLCSAHLAE